MGSFDLHRKERLRVESNAFNVNGSCCAERVKKCFVHFFEILRPYSWLSSLQWQHLLEHSRSVSCVFSCGIKCTHSQHANTACLFVALVRLLSPCRFYLAAFALCIQILYEDMTDYRSSHERLQSLRLFCRCTLSCSLALTLAYSCHLF